jgi:hypothetical protein
MPAGGARVAPAEDRDLAARVAHLFEAIVHPKTGEPYTNAKVARMSAGGLTEQDVGGIRTDAIAEPTVSQVAALAAVFGVESSYLVDGKEPPSLDAELIDGLWDHVRDNPPGAAPVGARVGDSPQHPQAVRGAALGTGRPVG